MKKKGFTLIELLVVIAIIGLLTTLAVVALNSARSKSRDARRVSDIRQIQTALELYFNSRVNPQYPQQEVGGTILGSATHDCLDSTGFTTGCTGTIFMGLVPSNPTPGGTDYTYTATQTGVGACIDPGDVCDEYAITFTLQNSVEGLPAGLRTATQDGIE